jgi:hypothetical protein
MGCQFNHPGDGVAEHGTGSRGAARVSQHERFHSAPSDAPRIDTRRG